MAFRTNLLILLFPLGCGLLSCAILGEAAPIEPARAPRLATVQVDTNYPGPAIPSTFMGISHEWYDSPRMMGSSQTGINTIYRRLLANLTAFGSGPIILRIGGDSTDKTKEPTPATVTPYAEVAQALGAHFILGVNLGGGDTGLAYRQTRAYLSQMPPGSVDGIELGNEPDEYYKNGMRQSAYSLANYLAEFDTWKTIILPILPPNTGLVGPAWAFTGTMKQNIQYFESREASVLSVFSQHYYATNPGAKPRADYFLTPGVALQGPSEVASAVAITHQYGTRFRLGEFSSISNAGVKGVSDAFGVALWAIDTMFEYAQVGVDGINWESSSGNYDNPFYFSIDTSKAKTTYSLTSVAPLYYGLLFFQAATGNSARLLPVHLATQANVKAWATIDSSGTPHLALINKDEASSGTVAITLQGYNHATVLRLAAPSVSATSGVTIGAQTFDGSVDGTLQGTPRIEQVVGTNGVFQIPLPVTSAALVTFFK